MAPWYVKHSNGFEEYFHPFFDLKSLYSPDRTATVFFSSERQKTTPLKPQYLEDYCAFCIGNIDQATPEKFRISRACDGSLKRKELCRLDRCQNETVLFRRQANLFEILSFDYWKKSYQIDSSPQELSQIQKDLSNPLHRDFLKKIIQLKNSRLNKTIDLSNEELLIEECKPLYSGFHELLTSGSHFSSEHIDGRLFSSASMSVDEHRISYLMLSETMQDMIARNKYIKFISIFQNWMYAAGASFSHWHKQILAIDFWGRPLDREKELFQNNPRIYEEFAIHTALEHDLTIAENEHAVAYLEVGAKSGFITICSKSSHLRPFEHSEAEISAMSDLAHAIATCIGDVTPYNEEWYYTPLDAEEFVTPWRIVFNIRSTVSAGFENITQKIICADSASNLARKLRGLLSQKISLGFVAKNISLHPKEIVLSYHKNK
ncbi:MAG: DUF4921 family protein [Brevinema sp.]